MFAARTRAQRGRRPGLDSLPSRALCTLPGTPRRTEGWLGEGAGERALLKGLWRVGENQAGQTRIRDPGVPAKLDVAGQRSQNTAHVLTAWASSVGTQSLSPDS